MNIVETYLLAIALPIGIAIGFLLLLRELDSLLDYWRSGAAADAGDDPYGLGPPRPGSIDHTLEEIRRLPEIYDWQREQAV